MNNKTSHLPPLSDAERAQYEERMRKALEYAQSLPTDQSSLDPTREYLLVLDRYWLPL